MDCPRCGTPMRYGICPNCGFPVTRMRKKARGRKAWGRMGRTDRT